MTETAPSPDIHPLSAEHAEQLTACREWVAAHFEDPTVYEDTANKLQVVTTILENGWIEPNETAKLQSLGVALGDALAEVVDLHWVSLSAEGNEWPGLRWEQTSLVAHPITMIAKRLEDDGTVDVVNLFRTVAEHIQRMKGQFEKQETENE
ncbi:MAG: DUF3806 domain-containing protein [Pseudomonadota bacterium]